MFYICTNIVYPKCTKNPIRMNDKRLELLLNLHFVIILLILSGRTFAVTMDENLTFPLKVERIAIQKLTSTIYHNHIQWLYSNNLQIPT